VLSGLKTGGRNHENECPVSMNTAVGFDEHNWPKSMKICNDLTSTYFECAPPEVGKRRFGYSRNKRPDCVQVVIALIVTPEGFPLAYDVMAGNTADKTTLADFLKKIEDQYGKADRT
jgi:transposase